MFNPSDSAQWQHTADNLLRKFYLDNTHTEDNTPTEIQRGAAGIQQFLIGMGARHSIPAIAQEIQLLYKEQGYAIADQPKAMKPIIFDKLQAGTTGVISTQPTAGAAVQMSCETVPFKDAINYLVYAFLDTFYQYEAKHTGITPSLAEELAQALHGLPAMEIEAFKALVAKAIIRFFYDHFDIETHGKLKYNMTSDSYFWCAKCTVGGSIMPGLFLTIPQFAKFAAGIPWQVQAGLPGIFLLLGLIINYSCMEAKCCYGVNQLPTFSAEQPPTREFLAIRKQQWTMFLMTIFGLAAEIMAPILKAKILPGVVSATTAAAVTSLLVTLGITGISGFVAYKLATECQKRGLCNDAPISSIIGQLSRFASWSASGCCFPTWCTPTYRSGYTTIQ